MLTILFFLLLFWQLKLFFRLLCSFLPEIHEPLIWISFSAEMSSSLAWHLLFLNQIYLSWYFNDCHVYMKTSFQL